MVIQSGPKKWEGISRMFDAAVPKSSQVSLGCDLA